jgi:hypothetical protein
LITGWSVAKSGGIRVAIRLLDFRDDIKQPVDRSRSTRNDARRQSGRGENRQHQRCGAICELRLRSSIRAGFLPRTHRR